MRPDSCAAISSKGRDTNSSKNSANTARFLSRRVLLYAPKYHSALTTEQRNTSDRLVAWSLWATDEWRSLRYRMQVFVSKRYITKAHPALHRLPALRAPTAPLPTLLQSARKTLVSI